AAKAALKAGNIEDAVRLAVDGVNDRDGDFQRLPPGMQAILLESGRALPPMFAAPPPPPIACEDLGRLGMPVTIAVGGDSRVFYRTVAEATHRCIPGSQLIKIPKARHFWPVQDPLAFGKLVLDFLAKG